MSRVRVLAIAATLPLAVLAAPEDSVSASVLSQPDSSEIPADWIWLDDDTGQIRIAVPPTWTEIDTAPDRSGQPWISATTNYDLFFPPEGTVDTYGAPGILYRALPATPDPTAWLETSLYHDFCASEPIEDFENDRLIGSLQSFNRCGGTDSSVTQVAATRKDNAFTAFLFVQLIGEADDEETLDHLLQSSGITGT